MMAPVPWADMTSVGSLGLGEVPEEVEQSWGLLGLKTELARVRRRSLSLLEVAGQSLGPVTVLLTWGRLCSAWWMSLSLQILGTNWSLSWSPLSLVPSWSRSVVTTLGP